MKEKNINFKEICFLVICVLATMLFVFKPLNGLSDNGHLAATCTLITVFGWILKPWNIPNSVCGLFMLGVMLASGLPAAVVFGGFIQNALWTLIGALFFGLVLIKTGLGKRVAIGLLSIVPSKWPAIIAVWVIIGVGLSLMTPSITVRASIMIPIALECCELYGLPKKSNSSSLLLLNALMMALIPGNGWLTGGLLGPMVQGVTETVPELQGMITFDSWLKASLLPALIITLCTAILGMLFLKPEQPLPAKINVGKIDDRAPMNRKEILAAVILIICCILFFASSRIHISSTAVCLLATVVFFTMKILDPEDFSHGINWDLIFFIGSGLSMSCILEATGLSSWMSVILSPVGIWFAQNRILFVLGILSLLFVWRFIDVTTLIPTMVILAPVITRVMTECNIHPTVWASIMVIASCSCFMSYTNMWAFMGKKLSGDYCWTEKQIFRYGLAFYLASVIGFSITIPYWSLAGLI